VRYSKLNLAVNSALAAVKILVGILSGSRALVAAAMYSINDVLSGIIFIVTLKVGTAPPDRKHPYGHGKAEFVAIALMSIILAVGVFLLLYFSLIDIVRGVTAPPHFIALGVAIIALIANGLLAKKGFCAARFYKSPALHTIAEHNQADAYSSAAVLVGVGGAALGFHVLDQIVAVFEALHILWLGGCLLGKSLKGLMDHSLPPGQTKALERTVAAVEGVVEVVALRTRSAGTEFQADIIVGVPDKYSVDEAQQVCARVAERVRKFRGMTLRTHIGFRAVPQLEPLTLGTEAAGIHG
jgi:cation diffusion facilitator family transporter